MKSNILKKLKILFVEDDEFIQKYISTFLKRHTNYFYLAKDGKEGLKLFSEINPDIIITDIQMPILSGLEMAKEIRKIDENVPIIVTTAFSEEEYLMDSINLKIDSYIRKPINLDDLKTVVYNCGQLVLNRREINIKNIILDSIGDGVITVNNEKKIIFANKAAINITGFSKDELLSKTCNELFDVNCCGMNNECFIDKSNQSGERQSKKIELKNSKNRIIDISVKTNILYEDSEKIGGVITFQDISAINALKKELTNKYTFYDIIGKNNKLSKIFEILPDISETDVTILITGESGTGKELLVNAIHNLSTRKSKPLIKINCATLPGNLFESELFGYKKGAFTDAKMDKPGRVESAEGGTLFLDEIGDLPLYSQPKLLRLIQEKEFDRLGDTVTRKADIRLITATNQKLNTLISEKKFREDLYYRISVIHFHLPPLRERVEDLPNLINHFISKFNGKYNKNIIEADNDAMEILLNYNYPGNIRELENIIEHSAILCKNYLITKINLPIYLLKDTAVENFDIEQENEIDMKSLKKEKVLELLKNNNNDKDKTASQLGIHRSTLWRWLKNNGEV